MIKNIKEWYISYCPDDVDGADLINDSVTFEELFDAMDNYKDVEYVIFDGGFGDTYVRECVMRGLSLYTGISEDVIFDQLHKCECALCV